MHSGIKREFGCVVKISAENVVTKVPKYTFITFPVL